MTFVVRKMFLKILENLILVAIFLGGAADADPQSDRAAFINLLINKGIFASTSVVNDAPTLNVTSTFHDSDADSKQSVCQTVYAYYQEIDSSYDTVLVVYAGTGTQIGVITASELNLF